MNISKLEKLIKEQLKLADSMHKEIFEKIYINDIKSNYSVSNFGRVRNDRFNKFLKISLKENKHVFIMLKFKGENYKFSIHRLVAEYFCIKRDLKHAEVVHHIDRNPHNNYFWNLIWLSNKEHHNIHKKIAYYNPKKGEDSPACKISNETIHNICKDIMNGMRNKDISIKYNINESYISELRSQSKRKDITKLYDLKPAKILKNRIKGNYDKKLIEDVAKLIKENKSNAEISSLTNVNQYTISALRNGKQYIDIYNKYNLKSVKPLKIKYSDEQLDYMTELIMTTNLTNKEISEKTKIPYASVSDARIKILKGKYARALKFRNAFND